MRVDPKSCLHEWGILSLASGRAGTRWCSRCGLITVVPDSLAGTFARRDHALPVFGLPGGVVERTADNG